MNTVKRNASEKNITMHHNPGAVVKPKKKLYKQKLAGMNFKLCKCIFS